MCAHCAYADIPHRLSATSWPSVCTQTCSLQALVASRASHKLLAFGAQLSPPTAAPPAGYTAVADVLLSLHRRGVSGVVVLTPPNNASAQSAIGGGINGSGSKSSGLDGGCSTNANGKPTKSGCSGNGSYARAHFAARAAASGGARHPIYELSLGVTHCTSHGTDSFSASESVNCSGSGRRASDTEAAAAGVSGNASAAVSAVAASADVRDLLPAASEATAGATALFTRIDVEAIAQSTTYSVLDERGAVRMSLSLPPL